MSREWPWLVWAAVVLIAVFWVMDPASHVPIRSRAQSTPYSWAGRAGR